MTDIEISIIIPVYNKAQYILTVLNNIKSQSFEKYECIIIDDGSTDESGEICDLFAKDEPRFRVVHIANGGVSNARNIGLSMANGKYITFIDADDRVENTYLQSMYECMIENDVDMVITGIKKVWDDGRVFIVDMPYQKQKSLEEILPDFARVQKETGIFGFCWGKLIKKEKLIDKNFNLELKLAEDFDFYLNVYPEINELFFLGKYEYEYLQESVHSSSIIGDNEIDYMKQLYLNLKYREFLIKMESYNLKNKKVVDNLIENYIYFSIFHAPRDKAILRAKELNKTMIYEKIIIKFEVSLRYFLITLIRWKLYKMIERILVSYDCLRKIYRGK